MYSPEPGASQEKRTFLPGNERGSDLFCFESALIPFDGQQSTYVSNRWTTTVTSDVEIHA